MEQVEEALASLLRARALLAAAQRASPDDTVRAAILYTDDALDMARRYKSIVGRRRLSVVPTE